MPSLGNLYVTLGAKTDALDQGIANAKKSLNDLSGVARTTIKSIGLLSAAAAGAGAGIVIGLVNSGRQAIDTQAKLAQALDGTIGGLRAAEMAAGDAGVATEEFYGAAKKMNQALGDATKQAGPAYDALTNLGLSAEQLINLDIDQRFAAIADAMKKSNISGAQAQDIVRDLGIRSENLANALRQGGDAFREQANEVDRLGLRLSMIDAAQVEAANDSLGIFQDVMTGVQDRLTVTAAPYITVLAEKFREAAIESGGFKSQTETAIRSIIEGIGKFADVMRGLQVAFKASELLIKGFGAASVSVFQLAAEGVVYFIDNIVIPKVNTAIAALNLLPKVDIAKVDPFTDSAFMDGLRDLGDTARNSVAETKTELHNLAMQEMPSEKIKRYLDEVAEASKAAAEKVVSARQSMIGGGGSQSIKSPVDTGDSKSQDQFGKDMAAWIKQQEMEVEAIKQRYMTEEQLEIEHRETMAIIGNEYDANKFESEAQWRSIREQAEADHQGKLTAINKAGAEERKAILGKALSDLSVLMNTNSRKMFEIGKAAAISQTVLGTIESAQKSYSALAGIPIVGPALGAAAAAAAIAGGMARVSAIKNQSFGSGGGAAGSVTQQVNSNSAPVSAGGGGGGGGGGAGVGQTLTVAPIDPNAIFSGASMQQFGQRIYDYSKDGGKVVFQA